MTRRKSPPVTLATTRQQILVVAEVPDVYEPTKRAKAAMNVREHALAYLRHIGTISEEQFLAGNEFRRNYEAAILGGFKAVDYARIRVSGGGIADPLTERVQRASKWLGEASQQPGVGPVGYSLLCRIAGEGETIRNVAITWPGGSRMSQQRTEGYIRGRLLECLDAMVEMTGVVARGAERRR